MADDDTDRERWRPAAELWERGCRGEALSDKEQRAFTRLARDRFYTFALSASHSEIQGEGSKIESLVRSLALDLFRAPGLEAEWRRTEWAQESFGVLVTAMLDEWHEDE